MRISRTNYYKRRKSVRKNGNQLINNSTKFNTMSLQPLSVIPINMVGGGPKRQEGEAVRWSASAWGPHQDIHDSVEYSSDDEESHAFNRLRIRIRDGVDIDQSPSISYYVYFNFTDIDNSLLIRQIDADENIYLFEKIVDAYENSLSDAGEELIDLEIVSLEQLQEPFSNYHFKLKLNIKNVINEHALRLIYNLMDDISDALGEEPALLEGIEYYSSSSLNYGIVEEQNPETFLPPPRRLHPRF